EVTEVVDIVLCMTVNPGWGGQVFIPTSLDKIARLRDLLPQAVALTVDGGIDADTADPCAQAGATLFVAGSAVFGSDDPVAASRASGSATCSRTSTAATRSNARSPNGSGGAGGIERSSSRGRPRATHCARSRASSTSTATTRSTPGRAAHAAASTPSPHPTSR